MSKRATLVLAVITAVMLAFIVVYERHTLSSGELESRRGRVLDRFVRPRVSRIALRRGDELIVSLVRDAEAEETLDTFDVGTWHLTEPVTGDADPDAIDGVLQACESLSARRTLERVSDEDRRRFGLDAPRLVLTLHVADETQVVRVGADDEEAGATYVEVEGSGRVHLVGRDFFEALDHDTDHFRSKELFVDLVPRDVQRIGWRLGETETRLERRDDRWVVTAPLEGWARRSTVDALIDVLVDARIARFVHDGGEALVGSPRATVEVAIREREGEARGTERTRNARLVVGSACPAGEASEGSETLAVRVDDGPIVCVPAGSLEALLDGDAPVRETRLLVVTEDQVERIEIGGSSPIVLRREDGAWEIGEGEQARPADDEGVAEYLRALREQEAESFEPATAENLAARGLDSPVRRVVVRRNDGAQVDEVRVGVSDTVGVWVRRGDEPVLARFVGSAVDLLAPSPLRFRSRELVAREPDDVLRLVIERGGVEEVLSTDNGAWRIEAPQALAADRVATRDLVRTLATLRAVRWLAEPATPVMGLDAPRVRVRLELREATAAEDDHDHVAEHEGTRASPPTSVELSIGAATEGGAYARLTGEPAVFVIADEVVRALAQPLVDRELVGLDTSSATRIAVTGARASFVLERGDDGRWSVDGRLAAPDATEAFLERLRSLRARGVVAYGPAGGGNASTLVVALSAPNGDHRIEIGAAEGDWYHVRRDDLPVDFQVSRDVVDALTGYRP
ncbi:MAG: hypothetical protein OHK0013_03620 [Sandaracinaceae bacterium]